MYKKGNHLIKKLGKLFRLAVLLFIIAIILKAFVLDAFQVPTSSMENTLLPGDYIVVSKVAYEISTPKEIPILEIEIPSISLFSFSKADINDLVIFDYPGISRDDSLIVNQKLVKRVVACPGDTLQIKDKVFFVNGSQIDLPSTLKISNEKSRGGWIKDENIYPPGTGWNKDNYGPFIIPGIGDTISIDYRNFDKWKQIIVMDYGKNVLREEGSIVTLDGSPIREYIIKKDHYFVIGDNLDNSLDSRYFGLVAGDMIIGEVLFIYWSIDNEKIAPGPLGFLSAIRMSRIFSGVQ